MLGAIAHSAELKVDSRTDPTTRRLAPNRLIAPERCYRGCQRECVAGRRPRCGSLRVPKTAINVGWAT
jgi:hypothetical protein